MARPREANVTYEAPSNSSNWARGDEASCVRRFSFKTRGAFRDVSVTHSQAVWYLYLDGSPMATERHGKWSVFQSKHLWLNFNVDVQGHEPLPAALTMDWRAGGNAWNYGLRVNNVLVPISWTKKEGTAKTVPPEVLGPPGLLELPASPPPVAPPPQPLALIPAGLENVCMTVDEAESAMPLFPSSAPSRGDEFLVQPYGARPRPPPSARSQQSRFVVCELTPEPQGQGAILTFCEQVHPSQNSRPESRDVMVR